jgi:hypothetical protein
VDVGRRPEGVAADGGAGQRCSSRRSHTKNIQQDRNQIHSAFRSSVEEALEADISTLR